MKTLKQQGSTYMIEYVVGAAAILSATILAAAQFQLDLDAALDTALANYTDELGSIDAGSTNTSLDPLDMDGG